MSGTFKVKRDSIKYSYGTSGRGSKSTIHHRAMADYYSETETGDGFREHRNGRMSGFFILVIATGLLASSCVSKKMLFKEQELSRGYYDELAQCRQNGVALGNENKDLSNTILQLEMQLENERSNVSLQEQQLEYFRNTNTNLLDRLADLSVVSKSGAESIRKSLEALNEQSKYIKDLTSSIRQRDSLNLALVMNLKRSLIDVGDEDINIEVRKGVVYISISDKMLFRSGSAEISPRAEVVLGKIARVLNDYQELEILVEGHTDNVPISTSCMVDNWDLSVKRATSVVRNLQTRHGIAPERMTAGGRSEYVPKETNQTTEGRQVNRRTEMIILPELEQFFQLLEPQMGMEQQQH